MQFISQYWFNEITGGDFAQLLTPHFYYNIRKISFNSIKCKRQRRKLEFTGRQVRKRTMYIARLNAN